MSPRSPNSPFVDFFIAIFGLMVIAIVLYLVYSAFRYVIHLIYESRKLPAFTFQFIFNDSRGASMFFLVFILLLWNFPLETAIFVFVVLCAVIVASFGYSDGRKQRENENGYAPWWLNKIRRQATILPKPATTTAPSNSSSSYNSGASATRAVVNLDAFDRNCQKCIDTVIEFNKKKNLEELEEKKKIRIATKSIRSIYLIQRFIRLILDEDPDIFSGLLCFSTQEMFDLVVWNHNHNHHHQQSSPNSNISFKHLLLAYPVSDEVSFQKLIEASQFAEMSSKATGKPKIQIATVIDSQLQAKMLLATFYKVYSTPQERNAEAWRCFPRLWIDVDMSWKAFGIDSLHFGVFRSLVKNEHDVKNLLLELMNLNLHTYMDGYQCYEAQIAGFPDYVAGGSKLLCFGVRRAVKIICSNSDTVRNRRQTIMMVNKDACFDDTSLQSKKLECNGGGSGSIAYSLSDPAVTEITIGSAALCGHQFDGYVSQPTFEPALYFTLSASRQPSENVYTCHGGGWIASGDPGENRLPKIVWPPNSSYLGFEGAGEVQTPIQVRDWKRVVRNPATGEIEETIVKSVKDQIRDLDAMSGVRDVDATKHHLPTLFVFRPNKSGELGEVFSEYVLVSKEHPREDMKHIKTYRGDGIHSWS